MNNKALGISVVICCYNSHKRLPDTLLHLSRQVVPDRIPVEILLVDNNSTDHTTEVAQKTWEKLNAPFLLRVLAQPIQGLAHAREKGIKEAGFEYIVLCDDDNWLEENYLRLTHEILTSNTEIGVLGGQSEAVSDVPFPDWFSTYQAGYAVGVQGLESGDITSRRYVWGAGMALRKSVYQKLKEAGFHSMLSDRKGNQLSSGGDSEICAWFILVGYKLWYDSRLRFKHYIPKERLTVEYCNNLFMSFNEYGPILHKYSLVETHEHKKPTAFIRWLNIAFLLIIYFYYALKGAQVSKNRMGTKVQLIINHAGILFDNEVSTIQKCLKRYKKANGC